MLISKRAVLKFAAATGATPIAGRFTPGTFTNQIQAAFREPRLLVVTDPRADHQPSGYYRVWGRESSQSSLSL